MKHTVRREIEPPKYERLTEAPRMPYSEVAIAPPLAPAYKGVPTLDGTSIPYCRFKIKWQAYQERVWVIVRIIEDSFEVIEEGYYMVFESFCPRPVQAVADLVRG